MILAYKILPIIGYIVIISGLVFVVSICILGIIHRINKGIIDYKKKVCIEIPNKTSFISAIVCLTLLVVYCITFLICNSYKDYYTNQKIVIVGIPDTISFVGRTLAKNSSYRLYKTTGNQYILLDLRTKTYKITNPDIPKEEPANDNIRLKELYKEAADNGETYFQIKYKDIK